MGRQQTYNPRAYSPICVPVSSIHLPSLVCFSLIGSVYSPPPFSSTRTQFDGCFVWFRRVYRTVPIVESMPGPARTPVAAASITCRYVFEAGFLPLGFGVCCHRSFETLFSAGWMYGWVSYVACTVVMVCSMPRCRWVGNAHHTEGANSQRRFCRVWNDSTGIIIYEPEATSNIRPRLCRGFVVFGWCFSHPSARAPVLKTRHMIIAAYV